VGDKDQVRETFHGDPRHIENSMRIVFNIAFAEQFRFVFPKVSRGRVGILWGRSQVYSLSPYLQFIEDSLTYGVFIFAINCIAFGGHVVEIGG